MNGVSRIFRSQVIGPLFALLLAVIIVSLTTNRFLTGQNLSNVMLQVSSVAIAAIGSTLVILAGGIDLSPGAIVALTACVGAILIKNNDFPVWLGIVLVLLLGAGLGLVNGLLSTYGRIPAFIVTLAMMGVIRGLAFLITGGTPIMSVSPDLEPIFYGNFLGLPLPLIYVVVLYAGIFIFLRYTIAGRAIYAVGGNESAARLSGVRVNQTRLMTFILAGTMSALAGVLTMARLNSGSPNYGVGTELQAIAAAVIGGASLAGGHGNIISTLFGALTVAVVQNGLNLNIVPAAWQDITLGGIIVLAVGLDMWRASISQRTSKILDLIVPKRPS
ncbi:MAG: ABC transporter permease [Chloroflexi bacterium]|nr:ABC transporter permease [Chloroflexota bacterium]MDL1883763.1 ABC transporter permease [Anaerolineae bacterium CFX8]